MAKKKETKQSPMQRLFVYAGKYKYLTIASWIFATISAFVRIPRTGKYESWTDETYFNAATWFYG